MTPAPTPIELWLVDLVRCAPALDELERATPRLADDDRERAGALGGGTLRHERIAAYIALRVLVERAVGAGMRRRPLVRDRGGAPRLADGGAWFSLSHTEGFAMIGLASAPPLGVDLERTRPLSIARYRREEFCAAAVGAASAPLPHAEPDRALLQAWVRLEALAKARGLGLARTLADLGLRGTGYPRPSPPHLEAAARNLALESALTVADVGLPHSLQGAAAVRSGRPLPHPRHLPTDRASIERLLQQPWCDLHRFPPRGSLATGRMDSSGYDGPDQPTPPAA